MIKIYRCEYTERGPMWVCRFFGVENWWGWGDTRWKAFFDALKFNKNPNYTHGL